MLTDRRTDGQTDRQTDRQTDGQTDGQTHLIVGLVTRNPPKNALFAHFHGKVAKLKIFHAKCRLFYLILIFGIVKNISKTNNKLKKNVKKKYFPKKVVPAITDICTGGQLCKYQLLGSGVNISYYLHGGDFFCYCSKKIWRNADITLKFCTHIHLGIMK